MERFNQDLWEHCEYMRGKKCSGEYFMMEHAIIMAHACIQMERRKALMNHGKSKPTAPHERGELFSSLSRVLDWWSDLGACTQRSMKKVMAYSMLIEEIK